MKYIPLIFLVVVFAACAAGKRKAHPILCGSMPGSGHCKPECGEHEDKVSNWCDNGLICCRYDPSPLAVEPAAGKSKDHPIQCGSMPGSGDCKYHCDAGEHEISNWCYNGLVCCRYDPSPLAVEPKQRLLSSSKTPGPKPKRRLASKSSLTLSNPPAQNSMPLVPCAQAGGYCSNDPYCSIILNGDCPYPTHCCLRQSDLEKQPSKSSGEHPQPHSRLLESEEKYVPGCPKELGECKYQCSPFERQYPASCKPPGTVCCVPKIGDSA